MLEVYKSSVENVRELTKQRKNIKRLFNKAIGSNDHSAFKAITRLYALLYSSFAEVSFLKVIHTPYGFSDAMISQIQTQRNLEEKWEKCIQIGFQAVDNMANRGQIQNKKQTLLRLVQEYVIQPSQIRNKIAHGQWISALNSDNSKVNPDTTRRISELDFVKIDILFLIYEKVGQVVEDLIESPRKAHFRDFYSHIAELESIVEDTKRWTLSTKISSLKAAYSKYEAIRKSRNSAAPSASSTSSN